MGLAQACGLSGGGASAFDLGGRRRSGWLLPVESLPRGGVACAESGRSAFRWSGWESMVRACEVRVSVRQKAARGGPQVRRARLTWGLGALDELLPCHVDHLPRRAGFNPSIEPMSPAPRTTRAPPARFSELMRHPLPVRPFFGKDSGPNVVI
ncbi:hypothetical protein ACTIVE_4350 [Actinomadura verrucosospora]|uniref:Uncharacterized protein n=1 Tax=Actinomadura verrucosospora TaxID=46165 RepID=A0A7D4AQR6_ACTVE|nr:hypothetical protein ACTIVE_4350 [Actinomadura verrucosospora]